MLPGGVGYSDTPTFGGFSPKSPCSDHALELGDMEAAFVGNLARYCMAIGTIPRHSLRGFWWVNGECKGILTYDEDAATLPIQGLINHLIYWAPYIIGTEGVDELLRAGEETRWYSQKMFPSETALEDQWVPTWKAEAITGRSFRTIRRWINGGSVRSLGQGENREIFKEDLLALLEIVKENQKRSPGRPRKERANHG